MSQILFYDADCGFCQASVDWISKDINIKLIPYQNIEEIKKYPNIDLLISNDEIQFLNNNKVYRGAEAIGQTLIYKNNILYKLLGYFILSCPTLFFAKVCYRIVAKNRKHISMLLGLNACKINVNK